MASRRPPRLILTRPAHEAARWVDALRARGIEAVALPLIEIAPLPAGTAAGPMDAAAYAALMFVSGAAVRGFFERNRPEAPALRTSDAIDLIASARCWAPGPGTAQALLAAGVPGARIDQPAPDAAEFDSESLWAQVQGQVRAGTRVLLVRGGDASGRAAGREWLAQSIAGAGGSVDTAVVYRRLAPRLDAAQRALAQGAAQAGRAVWVFSSSEAIANLQAELPDVDWSAARAWATHPRIADAARAAGFGAVTQVSPSLEALVASIELIR